MHVIQAIACKLHAVRPDTYTVFAGKKFLSPGCFLDEWKHYLTGLKTIHFTKVNFNHFVYEIFDI